MQRLILSSRDTQVVQAVRQLRHATSRQLHDLIFYTQASKTPCDRSLNRLVKHGYLHRAKQFSPVGGGGHYIYRLARLGHELTSEPGERFEPARYNVNHSLAIGECVVTLHKLERAGELRLVGVDIEQDTPIGGQHLKPDLYAFLVRPDGRRNKIWMEVDLATEGPKRLQNKLRLYTRAYHNYAKADLETWPEWPLILWVTLDEDRVERLKLLIDDLPHEDRTLFRVTTFTGLFSFLKRRPIHSD